MQFIRMFASRSINCIRFYQTNKVKADPPHRRGVVVFIKKNLLLTNSLSSGLCMFLGDLGQQEIEYQSELIPERYEWARLARMFIIGTLIGPFHHYYYVYLDKLLPKASVKTAVAKIMGDQLVCAPLTIVGFFFGMGLLEQKSTTEISDELYNKFLYVYMGDCLYWPPIQFINFYYLPTHYRVLYINVATMLFNVFLSYMKHFDQHESIEQSPTDQEFWPP